MSLVNFRSNMRHLLFISIVIFAFLLTGCGSSEEATTEQPSALETKPPVEEPKEKPMDQALTSFLGADTVKPVEAAKPTVNPSQLAQYEKQIEDLRTENTGLKQKVVKLEQENRGINSRMGEVEAKYSAEKLRADKAEEIVKNTALTPKPVVTEPIETKTYAPSESTYNNALKAFNARRYDDAVAGFKSIVDAGGNDDLAVRSKYWLGETYFAKKKYKEAMPLFQDALKAKNSEKKGDAQFMIAQTYERLGNKAKAKQAYENVVKEFPMSKNVKRAKERWAKL